MGLVTKSLFKFVADVFSVSEGLPVPVQANMEEGINFTYDLARRTDGLLGRYVTYSTENTHVAAGDLSVDIDPFNVLGTFGEPPADRWDPNVEDLWVLQSSAFQTAVTGAGVLGVVTWEWVAGNPVNPGFGPTVPAPTLIMFVNTLTRTVPSPLLGAATSAILAMPFRVPDRTDGSNLFRFASTQTGIGSTDVTGTLYCWIGPKGVAPPVY